MNKLRVIVLLILIILICIIKSKHTSIIIKNNIKSFIVQTFISALGIMISCLFHGELYENSTSSIIYDIPKCNEEIYTRIGLTIKGAYFCESIIRIICIVLFVIFGMSLIKQKSKLKNFLSVFICYLVLIIIESIYPLYFQNIFVWVPYIFISSSAHAVLQRATPLIYNTVFYILLFIPTLFIWIGLELKSSFIKKFLNKI